MRRPGRPTIVVALAAILLAMPPGPPADAAPKPGGPASPKAFSPGGPGDHATSARRGAVAADSTPAPSADPSAFIDPVGSDSQAAMALARAAVDESVVSAGFVHVPPATATHAVAWDLAGFPTNGDTAALLTTGDARWAPEPDDYESSGRDSGGGIDRGESTYDVTVLRVTFFVPSGVNCLNMRFRFLSEELPEFAQRAYNDAFIAELDGLTWTTSGTTINAPGNFAHDPQGKLVSTNNSRASMTASNAAGTTYDAATPMMSVKTPITGGRQHDLYLSIFDQYDAQYDSAVLVDEVVAREDGSCVSGPASPFRPIIFLPGITGSQLVTGDGKEAFPRALQTLVSNSDSHYDQLRLLDDGSTNCDGCDIRVGKVLRKVLTVDAYDSTIKHLGQMGYVLDDDGRPEAGESLFLHPFDWRRSALSQAEGLLQHIEAVRNATGVDKVNLLAHSQGGLVVRATLALAGSVDRVNRVVTLGTPNLGAAKALSQLRFKEPCQQEILGSCAINKKKVAELGRNFRGFLDLLPSAAYWQAVGSPIVRTYDADNDGTIDGPLDQAQVREILGSNPDPWGSNIVLIDLASAWHANTDRWAPADPQVGLVRVVGDGRATIVAVNDGQRTVCTGILWWRECHVEPYVTLDSPSRSGDGTVPTGSADLSGTGLGGGAPTFYDHELGHGDLPKDRDVLEYAVGVLRVNGPTGAVTSTSTSREITGVTAPPRLSLAPAPLAGTQLLVKGPATGLLTDADGWRTGVTDPARDISVADIPGSSFEDGQDFSATFLTTGSASGRWIATAAGDVRFTLRAYESEAISRTVPYPPVHVAAGAVVTLDPVAVPIPSTAPALRVDDNADGTVDRTVPAGPPVTGGAAADIYAPKSTVTLDRYTTSGGERRVRVTLAASDGVDGSGVDRIEWAHDPQGNSGVYTGVLDLPASGTLYVRSIDRVGNVEVSYRVVSLA